MNSDLEKHIEHLVSVLDGIPEGKISILTGSNGSGKSVIRKQLSSRLKTAQTSLEQRTSSNPNFGALSGIMQDTGWLPSSEQTLTKIEGLVEKNSKDRYVIIDEPEIGMGEETVMALCSYLNNQFEEKMKSKEVLGFLVITHNRYLIEHLKTDNFFCTDEEITTKKEWLNRKLIPTDLADLKENKLFYVLRDRGEARDKQEKKQ